MNSKEQTPEEHRHNFQEGRQIPLTEKPHSTLEIDPRHYAPILTALPHEASGYVWKRETGDIQTYRHSETGGWLHIDPQGQFYDRQAQPLIRGIALERAFHPTDSLSRGHVESTGIHGQEHGISL